MELKCDIFISYRRVDGRDIARTVQLALKAKGYENIFFDYDSLRDGLFNEQIIDAINMCKDFILILSPESMKRCCNEGDWVARELDTAIKAGCKFIPLNINGSFQEFPADFPRSLSVVKYIEQTKLMTDEYFDASIEMLVNRLDSKPVRTAVKSALCSIQLSIDETSMVYLNNEQLFKLKAGGQRLIENLETDKEYTLRVENLSRRGEEIVKTFIPGDQSILALSYAAEREERKRLEQEEKARKKAEDEQLERERMAMQVILDTYDFWWHGGEAGELIVEKNGKLGYFDPNTKVQTIACEYDQVSVFVDGVACVKKDQQIHLINTVGQILLQDISESMAVPHGNYIITEKGGMMGLIDFNGQIVLEHQYDELLSTELEHMYVLQKDGKWAMYSITEGRVVSTWYDEMQLSRYWAQDKIGYISNDNKNLRINLTDYFTVPVLTNCHHISGGWSVVVRRGTKFGLLDNTGREVLSCMADKLRVFDYEDAGLICVNEKYGLVNKHSGQMITPMIYDTMNALIVWGKEAQHFLVGIGDKVITKDGFACALVGGVGVIDNRGIEVVPIMYDYLGSNIKEIRGEFVIRYKAYSLTQQQWDYWNFEGQKIPPFEENTIYSKEQILKCYKALKNASEQTSVKDHYYIYYRGRQKGVDAVTSTKSVSVAEIPSNNENVDIAKIKEQTKTVLSIVTVNYDTRKKTVEITGFVKDFSGELVIPEMLWHLGYNMAYRVTSISSYGFRNHTGMTAITLPEGVSELDEYTFYQCTSLKRATLPKSLRIIGQQCFAGCTALAEIVIPEGVTEIQDWAFSRCSSLKRIVLPDSVTTMGQQVFRECRALEEIVLPRSIETMGDYMFHDCPNLKRICIPKGQKAKFKQLLGMNMFTASKLQEI